MQRIETPKGKETYFNIKGSNEKIAFRTKLMIGEFILFSESTFNPRIRMRRLPKRIGKKRKKLK